MQVDSAIICDYGQNVFNIFLILLQTVGQITIANCCAAFV